MLASGLLAFPPSTQLLFLRHFFGTVNLWNYVHCHLHYPNHNHSLYIVHKQLLVVLQS